MTKANNFAEASDRMEAADEQAQELVDIVTELEASTIEGIRAKALAVLFEARPNCAAAMDEWNWPDDGGATYSLFYDVARLIGLLPMVEHYEAKLEKVAEEIALAGGNGSDSAAEQVAEETPQPWTREEWAASYRRLIDHCTISSDLLT